MVAGYAKLIAICLAVTILGGAQCLSLCIGGPCNVVLASKAQKQTSANEKSHCHHRKDSQPQKPHSKACSHQEFVAEKDSEGTSVGFTSIQTTLPELPVHDELIGSTISDDSFSKVRLKRPTILNLRI